MISAWQYAVSAVESALTATEGLTEYRTGGGAIRTQDWYYLAGQARESYSRGETVSGLPFETPIPSSAYTVVDLDYGQKYVVVVKSTYTDAVTGKRITRDITVESDEVLPWNDIESDALDVLERYNAEGGRDGITISRAQFYTPTWTTIPFD